MANGLSSVLPHTQDTVSGEFDPLAVHEFPKGSPNLGLSQPLILEAIHKGNCRILWSRFLEEPENSTLGSLNLALLLVHADPTSPLRPKAA